VEKGARTSVCQGNIMGERRKKKKKKNTVNVIESMIQHFFKSIHAT
jgi:hypothetical protein